MMKTKNICVACAVCSLSLLLSACSAEKHKNADIQTETAQEETVKKEDNTNTADGEVTLKDKLSIDEEQKKEAEQDCKEVMKSVQSIYEESEHSSDASSEQTKQMMQKMKTVIKQSGNPVIGSENYSVMENYQKMEAFLEQTEQKEKGSVILYKIDLDGGITRNEYIYDGKTMNVLSVKMIWNKVLGDANSKLEPSAKKKGSESEQSAETSSDDSGTKQSLESPGSEKFKPVQSSISYNEVSKWSYTDKGNFCYELQVPEPPEVSEIVDGSYIIRVKPLSEECRNYSEKYVLPIGYQGNNLLTADWDSEHMQNVDYTWIFDYFYRMKYGESYQPEADMNGVPAEEFEAVITEYLPVKAEQLREWSDYNEQENSYKWKRWGCVNSTPTHIGHSVPEVKEIVQNEDGTETLTIDAVCASVVCDDAVLTHKLTIKLQDDGSVQYLENQIVKEKSEIE